MKDQWYGDKRDLIKWGGIVHLCNKTGIKHVLQVAYYRESTPPRLSFDGLKEDIPIEVCEHFRDIEDIKRLGKKAGLIIDVVKNEFRQANRKEYNTYICKRIQKQTNRQTVFLDPDTGLASRNAKEEHVKSDEVSMIWKSVKRGDVLVLYQHSFRDSDWKSIRRKQIAEACGIDRSKVKKWEDPLSASDVVFFFCEK